MAGGRTRRGLIVPFALSLHRQAAPKVRRTLALNWMRGRNLTVSPGYEPSVATFYYPADESYHAAPRLPRRQSI